ncbi:hypothetical protein DFH08DRAFT_887327 [Mycena albidolilacea]|uniref:Uncharacterized protein n=1 Tax=Mycena albidolilacea TaxID=1033008 RepID=A0AAD7EIB8_9AGAR|nr:hypothetical protein DFH08DRAFT_887327 [Mycena albidolilacea]
MASSLPQLLARRRAHGRLRPILVLTPVSTAPERSGMSPQDKFLPPAASSTALELSSLSQLSPAVHLSILRSRRETELCARWATGCYRCVPLHFHLPSSSCRSPIRFACTPGRASRTLGANTITDRGPAIHDTHGLGQSSCAPVRRYGPGSTCERTRDANAAITEKCVHTTRAHTALDPWRRHGAAPQAPRRTNERRSRCHATALQRGVCARAMRMGCEIRPGCQDEGQHEGQCEPRRRWRRGRTPRRSQRGRRCWREQRVGDEPLQHERRALSANAGCNRALSTPACDGPRMAVTARSNAREARAR